MTRIRVLIALAALTYAMSAAAAELEVLVGAGPGRALTQDQLAQLAPEQVEFGTHETERASYSCAALTRILGAVDVPSGAALRGTQLRRIALVEAADAYTVAFSLGELDEALGNTRAFLCWAKNGRPLDEQEGPLRLIIPGDTRAARSVRQVVRIRIVDAAARSP
jgi:Oxidoreductase molybdopterin binding domain